MKKTLKVIGIILLILIIVIVAAPLLFEKQMANYVKKTINSNLNATVAFSDADLSFIRSFPQASLVLEDLVVINKAPFAGDTLFFAENVSLNMSLKELFNNADEPMAVNDFKVSEALLNIKINSLGNSNYDIAVQENAPVETSAEPSAGFNFDVQHYEIENAEVNYLDETSNIFLKLQNLQHQGTGNFAAAVSELSTTSSALVSMEVDGTQFLDKNSLELVADFKMDLENQKYTFLENEAKINQLPLKFDGFVQVNEDHNLVDIAFATPSSSFKNFLAVMPQEYSKNIEDVETEGDFIVDGKIEGIIDEQHIPKINIQIASQNASFKYPDLPKAVEDITIDAQIVNETGLADDTYVNIDALNFKIDEDRFAAEGNIKNLTGNMLVNMAVNGTINLANLKQAYPLEMEQDLNGVLTANLQTTFDMESVEKEQFQNIKSSGTASLRDFSYEYEEFPNEIFISEAKMSFQPAVVKLQNLEAKTGQSDVEISGTLNNLMGYLFTDQQLKGNFRLNSNTFAVADFMTTEVADTEVTETPSEETAVVGQETFKIPAFLDATIEFNADKVLYDNLSLQETKGSLIIKDEAAKLQNVSSNLFGGRINLTGNISTKAEIPAFEMALDLNSFDIVETFENLELLGKLAPIAEALQGSLDIKLDLGGALNEDLTPNLQTLTGTALAEILNAEVNSSQSELLATLDNQLNFVNTEDLNLKDLKTNLVFDDGAVNVKPFNFNIKDIQVTASGSHNFDMLMDYDVELDIPAKYLGSEIGNLLSRLSTAEAASMKVALPINIGGTFQAPKIQLGLEQAIQDLSQRIIEKQKEQVKDEMKEKGKDLLNDILGNNNQSAQDTTATQQTTPRKEDEVKEAVKDVLGGLFGKKKNKE